MQPITIDQVKSKIIKLRNHNVILDSDVARLYGVETKRINEAASRNPEKFPDGYLINLTTNEWMELKSQIVTSIKKGGKVKLPTAFTERGLYMLATILKSPTAIKTTIAIINTFSQIKDLANSVNSLAKTDNEMEKIKIIKSTTDIITDLLDNNLISSEQETSFKIKLPFFEMTRKITKVKKH